MRDIGYSIETAIADIVDNCITAGANRVDIRHSFRGLDSMIAIIDDGHGMSEAGLVEAMRPGTKSPTDARAEGDLGRFGLGLKTASFSQCRRLTAISRRDGRTSAAIWDLDRVVEEDDWTLQLPDDASSLAEASLLGRDGTVVVWEKLDRLAGEDGEIREEDFARLMATVEEYLALVFHRFLLGRNGAPKLAIAVNGREIDAFDPFFSRKSFAWPEDYFKIGDTVMRLQTFTLPHYSSVSKSEWERHAGAEGYVKNQGFYVFRGNRLIVYGTWFSLMRQGELTKLTRVALDLPTSFDGHWKVDVKKASAQPPSEVRKYLRGLIEAINVPGKKVFKHKGTKAVAKERLPIWRRVVDGEHVSYVVDQEHPAIAHLLATSPSELVGQINAVLELVAGGLPLAALYNDVAASPETIHQAKLSSEALVTNATNAAKQLYEQLEDRAKVVAMMRVAERFAPVWGELEGPILETLDGMDDS